MVEVIAFALFIVAGIAFGSALAAMAMKRWGRGS